MKIVLNFDGSSGNGQKYLESGYILKVKLTGGADGLPDSIVGQSSAHTHKNPGFQSLLLLFNYMTEQAM